MATRNPTSFREYIDELLFLPGQGVRAVEINRAVNDQEFIIDCPKLVLSECFHPIGQTSATYVTELYRWYLDTKDMGSADGGANIAHTVYVLCRGNVATAGNVKILTSGAADSVELAIPSGTTWTWVASASGDLNMTTDGAEETITMQIKSASGGTAVYCAGILIFAVES